MERVDAITGMRGVAALLVVGFHGVLVVWLAQQVQGLPDVAFQHPLSAWLFGGGWIGVDFFFVLSAFLLGGPLLHGPRAWPGKAGYKRYAVRRLLRLAPPYYASMVVAFLLVGWTRDVNFAVTWDGLVVHALYLHSFFQQHQFAQNPVYWTLAIELQLYLLLPLLVQPFRRWGAWAALPFIAVALAYNAWAMTGDGYFAIRFREFQFPSFLGHFGLGLAAAHLAARPWRTPLHPDGAIAIAAGACLVLPAVLLGYTQQFAPTDGGWRGPVYHILLRPLAALAFAILIVAALQPGSRVGRALATRPALWAGEVSYSVYLTHLPLAAVLLVFAPAFVVRVGVAGYTTAVLVASVALGSLFYLLVEAPSLRLKDRVSSRLRAPAPEASHA